MRKHTSFKNKTILITGGTGSFGWAFVEYLLKYAKPKVVRIYSRDEWKQNEMKHFFRDEKRLRFLIGDVRDAERLARACEGADILVHAAAMKQILACEYNPIEAIRTNIDGSVNVINCALDLNIAKVVMISSDKAVHPINIYGATKLCAEKLFIQANSYVGANRKTSFSVVRYGNVLASRGSVIPLFKELLAQGKPITVTDERMSRFWISLDWAVEFIASCVEKMRGGEIFVPKLPSMKIVDLAKAFDGTKKFLVVGRRLGEKINEELITREESERCYDLGDRYVIVPNFDWAFDVASYINQLGKQVPEGFSYSSDKNTKWLYANDLKRIIK